jgi:hypothetical protein
VNMDDGLQILESLLLKYCYDDDDRGFTIFDEAISAIASNDPTGVLDVAAVLLRHRESRVRSAAAHALIRVADVEPDDTLLSNIEDLALDCMRDEREDVVVERLATLLGRTWGRNDNFINELKFAQHSNLNYRRAAAKALALAAPDPLPERLEAVLEVLVHDAEPEVQDWAKIGLFGWPNT